MVLKVWEDVSAIGYAKIDLGRRVAAPVRLSFQRVEEEPRHLGKEGWQPEIAWIEVSEVETGSETSVARVGPMVVSRIGEFERIEIVADGVGELGVVSWPEMARPAVDLEYGHGLWDAGKAAVVTTPATPPEPQPEAVPPPQPQPRPKPDPLPEPVQTLTPTANTGSRPPLWLGLILVTAACAAAAVHLSGTADLCRMAGVEACARPIEDTPRLPPPPPIVTEADTRAQLDSLIEGSATDAQFIEMGTKALTANFPLIALRAFEQVDPKQNEEAAFQIARIYDPLVTDAVYASVQNRRPERASPYYNYFKRTSARHAEALKRLCDANLDLKRANAKFADECRS